MGEVRVLGGWCGGMSQGKQAGVGGEAEAAGLLSQLASLLLLLPCCQVVQGINHPVVCLGSADLHNHIAFTCTPLIFAARHSHPERLSRAVREYLMLAYCFSFLICHSKKVMNAMKAKSSCQSCVRPFHLPCRETQSSRPPSHRHLTSRRLAACRQLPPRAASLPRRGLKAQHMHHYCTNAHTDTIWCTSAGQASLEHNGVIICIFIVS